MRKCKMTKYKTTTMLSLFVFIIISSAFLHTVPKDNDGPGCTGDECHVYKKDLLEAKVIEGLEVEVKINGVSSSRPLGFELVDSDGNVVDYINETRKNPFYLRAKKEGTYTVYAGYHKPEEFDSVIVEIKTVGVKDDDNSSSLYLYPISPNPAKDNITVKYNLELYDTASLTLYDIHLNKIKEYHINNLCFCKEYMSIDISNIPSGHYYLELNNGKDRFTRKLMITK
jgi:hypothetical protein